VGGETGIHCPGSGNRGAGGGREQRAEKARFGTAAGAGEDGHERSAAEPRGRIPQPHTQALFLKQGKCMAVQTLPFSLLPVCLCEYKGRQGKSGHLVCFQSYKNPTVNVKKKKLVIKAANT